MASSFTFEIDGVVMPTPAFKNFKLTVSDADGPNTTRNAKAFLNRDRVRKGLRKIEVLYNFLTNAQAKVLLDAVDPVYVMVKYFDPQLGLVTKEMYVGDRVLPMYGLDNKGNDRWENLSFSLIER